MIVHISSSIANGRLIAMIGLFIGSAGAAGFLLGIILLVTTLVIFIFCRKLFGRGNLLAFILLAFVGIVGWRTFALHSFTVSHSDFPTGEVYSQAAKGLFLVGLTPGGSILGLLSVCLRK